VAYEAYIEWEKYGFKSKSVLIYMTFKITIKFEMVIIKNDAFVSLKSKSKSEDILTMTICVAFLWIIT
jgi:hypothetical protein